MNNPDYPVIINSDHTGIGGVACALCSVSDTENLLSLDDTDYATISLTAGVLANGSVSVEDVVSTYTGGTFAGYEIANTALLGVDLLDNITITTYLDGVQQEQKSGTANLVSATTNILTGDGRRVVGFATSQDFDEIQLTIGNTLSVDVSATNVYRAVVENFCPPPSLACNTPNSFSNTDFPVIINSEHTGTDSAICALCEVTDSENVITDNETDYATVELTAGVIAEGSISVEDVLTTYPVSTFAGFEIKNTTILDADVLDNITITTYLDGVQRESERRSWSLSWG